MIFQSLVSICLLQNAHKYSSHGHNARHQKSGCKIALDDFGAGYTSFGQLSKLPIDYLKIDRSFIDDKQVNSQTSLVVSNLVKTCHDLNVKTVAKGVEDELAFQKVL